MQDERSFHKKVAEAALFVSGRALSLNEISGLLGVSSIGYVKKLLSELIDEYRKRDTSLIISELGDSYQMSIKDEYVKKVESLAGAPDISKGALRILAYIAKNEPIMQSQVVKGFGTTVYDYVKELVEKGFVSSVRLGRSKRLTTTNKFKEYFNLSEEGIKKIEASPETQ